MPSPRRAKLLLLIPHLGGGGAEHVIATLASSLNSNRYEVHLGLVAQSAQVAYDIPRRVAVHALGAKRVRNGAWRLLRLVWRLRPALILSSMAHLNLLVLLLRPFLPARTRLCVRQNGALPATFAALGHPQLARRLYATAYRSADRVICQTKSMAAELRTNLCIDNAKLSVLPNPVDIHRIRAVPGAANVRSSPGPRLLAVARLAPEKGIDLLLVAFAGIHRNFPDAELEILGTGPCRASLEEQRKKLQLERCVRFHGSIAFPAGYFPRASVFRLFPPRRIVQRAPRSGSRGTSDRRPPRFAGLGVALKAGVPASGWQVKCRPTRSKWLCPMLSNPSGQARDSRIRG